MAAGANIGSALAGFGRGFSKMLLYNRERADERKREERIRTDREFERMLPVHLKLFEETGDPVGLESFVGQYHPEMAKTWKKSGSPFGQLAPLLTLDQQAMRSEQDSAIAAGGAPAPLPSRNPVIPTTPRKTLFGVELPTEEEKLAKATRQVAAGEMATVQGKRDAALRIAATGVPLMQAYEMVGLRTTASSATPPQPGSIGNMIQLRNAERAASGLPAMTAQEVQDFVNGQTKSEANARSTFGQDREAIARAMFAGKAFGDLTPEEQAAVIEEEEKKFGRESRERGLGTADAKFNAPLDIAGARENQLPVGTTAAQVSGQVVPTDDQNDRRRALGVLQQDLNRIQDLIAVLPAGDALGGTAPGAWLAVRRRMNSPSEIKDPATGQPLSYREAIAQLEAVVESTVNVLARARAEQRGTQTERDADRAYAAIVNLKAGLTDPFGGDTRESAQARIKESIDGIQRVLAGLPATPQPRGGAPAAPKPATVTPPAQPATGGTGLKMDAQGNILDASGRIVVPAQ